VLLLVLVEIEEPFGLLLFLLYMGLVDEIGDESLGEPFGLNVKPFNDELRISIGRKHCASGLKVVVTSRSALLSSGESCFCSE
jgi:hypothetical protein